MVLLANGGADVSRARGSGCGSSARNPIGADVGGHRLRTRYNRNIRCAAVAVGQCSLVADAAEDVLLLLQFQQRIRLKLRLVSGSNPVPLHYQRRASLEHLRTKFDEIEGPRDGCCGQPAAAGYGLDSSLVTRRRTRFPIGLRAYSPRFDLRGPFCDKAHSICLRTSTEKRSLC